MKNLTLIIPCFNESQRLDQEQFILLRNKSRLKLLFVDDGSNDNTFEILNQLCKRIGSSANVIRNERNLGKAESVRRGFLHAIESGSEFVGYADADLATPPEEIHHLIQTIQSNHYLCVIGSRVKILGSTIDRKLFRHLFGRVFATFASIILNAPVYDTQCGAKIFVVDSFLKCAVRNPFHSRWAFDVEFLGRLLKEYEINSQKDAIVEVPLRKWVDIEGSKLNLFSMAKTFTDLFKIYFYLKRYTPVQLPRRELNESKTVVNE